MLRVAQRTFPVALLLASSVQADVLTVGGPSPDFAALQAAIDAANDGDTLLVRSSLSTDVCALVDAKTLALVGEAPSGNPVALNLSLEVRNLAAGQFLALENFAIQGLAGPGLSVRFCAGSVRVDRCTILGEPGQPGSIGEIGPQGEQGVYVTQSVDVAFSDCTITGGPGAYGDHSYGTDHSYGGDGLFARESNVALYDCQVTGGVGGSSDDHAGFDGAIGLRNADSFVYLSGSTIVGGRGGDGADEKPTNPVPGCGGNGGFGVELTTLAQVDSLDTPVVGGAGGWSGESSLGFECNGLQGQPLLQAAGSSFVTLPGSARSFTASGPVRELEPTALHFEGQPGDLAFAYLSTGCAFASPTPLFTGPRLFAVPAIRRFLVGQIPASGVLDATLVAPPLSPSEENRTWFLQGTVVGGGQAFAVNAEPWILLDSAF